MPCCPIAHDAPARSRGFTLVELMVTVAIVGIVAAIGYPAFQNMLAAQRVRAASSSLYESVIAARGEAVKRNETVSIVSTGLSNGWAVSGADGVSLHSHPAQAGVTFTPSEPSLQINARGRPVADADVDITATGTTTKMSLRLRTTGRICIDSGIANGGCQK